MKMLFNPIYSFIRTLSYFMTGKVSFPKERIGEVIVNEDGQKFEVFRQVIIKGKQGQESPKARFRVCFQLSGMSPETNIKFSIIPIPFFVGLPGFRSKLWMINKENGYFQGVYEWDTKEHARLYAKSFAMYFMCKRSIPGSIKYIISSIE